MKKIYTYPQTDVMALQAGMYILDTIPVAGSGDAPADPTGAPAMRSNAPLTF